MKTIILNKKEQKTISNNEAQARNIVLKLTDHGRLVVCCLTNGHLEDVSDDYSALTYVDR